PSDNSCITVFPANSPDAARTRATAVLSARGTRPCNAAVPAVVGASRVSMLSLTAKGIPASSPTPYDRAATVPCTVSSNARYANAFSQLRSMVRACSAARYSVCEICPPESSCRAVRIVHHHGSVSAISIHHPVPAPRHRTTPTAHSRPIPVRTAQDTRVPCEQPRTNPTDMPARTESSNRTASLVLDPAAARARVVAAGYVRHPLTVSVSRPAVRRGTGPTSLFPFLDITHGRVPE